MYPYALKPYAFRARCGSSAGRGSAPTTDNNGRNVRVNANCWNTRAAGTQMSEPHRVRMILRRI
eukprot:593185-Pyramimonas_sp.AAC.1